MIKINKNYQLLEDNYLFSTIVKKTDEYKQKHPEKKLLLLGVGDVSEPLCKKAVSYLYDAVDDQSKKESFHGYLPECGTDFLKESILNYYKRYHVDLSKEEVFVTSGAGDDLGSILDLFESGITALVIEPAYPAYVDTNIMAGNKVIHLDTSKENGFVPFPDYSIDTDLIYICSPNNPTGAVFDYNAMKQWVDYANKKGAVIIFDAAYEAFIESDDVPHSIFEIPGSRTCAIEICSLSKTAGFTGVRCGYTVVPDELIFDNISLNKMWTRNRCTKTNGVSYIVQRGAEGIFTDEGIKQSREILKKYKENAKILMTALKECDILYYGGKNAPYIWMECQGGMSSWEFFEFMLEKAQIVGTPGEGFGECGKHYLRLSSFAAREDIIIAAERIVELFKK